jgi:hypothetical protein
MEADVETTRFLKFELIESSYEKLRNLDLPEEERYRYESISGCYELFENIITVQYNLLSSLLLAVAFLRTMLRLALLKRILGRQ